MSDTRIDDRSLEDSAEDAAFRLEVRRWLEANAPAEPGSTPSEGGAWTPASQSARAWQARLVDGWAGRGRMGTRVRRAGGDRPPTVHRRRRAGRRPG